MNLIDKSTILAFRVLIENKGISNKEVAKTLGVSETGISKITHLRRCLSFSEVHMFCEKFGIPISEVSILTNKFLKNKKVLKQLQDLQNSKATSRKLLANFLKDLC